ncbi:restriction endonuclease [Streptomyces thinghirensis]|nr:restriction endonuclease [Streptomyces thinghirensis]
MTWRAFEHHVADLLRRDGCVDVVVRQARTDRGIDITGRTADGRTVAVQCKNRSGRWTVPSADMQKFAGAARCHRPRGRRPVRRHLQLQPRIGGDRQTQRSHHREPRAAGSLERRSAPKALR